MIANVMIANVMIEKGIEKENAGETEFP